MKVGMKELILGAIAWFVLSKGFGSSASTFSPAPSSAPNSGIPNNSGTSGLTLNATPSSGVNTGGYASNTSVSYTSPAGSQITLPDTIRTAPPLRTAGWSTPSNTSTYSGTSSLSISDKQYIERVTTDTKVTNADGSIATGVPIRLPNGTITIDYTGFNTGFGGIGGAWTP